LPTAGKRRGERFPPTRLSVGYEFRKTIAGALGNDEDAPIVAIHLIEVGPAGSIQSGSLSKGGIKSAVA
jgi:hypothetical protein